jgi:hypothetical protein
MIAVPRCELATRRRCVVPARLARITLAAAPTRADGACFVPAPARLAQLLLCLREGDDDTCTPGPAEQNGVSAVSMHVR